MHESSQVDDLFACSIHASIFRAQADRPVRLSGPAVLAAVLQFFMLRVTQCLQLLFLLRDVGALHSFDCALQRRRQNCARLLCPLEHAVANYLAMQRMHARASGSSVSDVSRFVLSLTSVWRHAMGARPRRGARQLWRVMVSTSQSIVLVQCRLSELIATKDECNVHCLYTIVIPQSHSIKR